MITTLALAAALAILLILAAASRRGVRRGDLALQLAEHERPDAVRVAEAGDAVAHDQHHDGVAAAAAGAPDGPPRGVPSRTAVAKAKPAAQAPTAQLPATQTPVARGGAQGRGRGQHIGDRHRVMRHEDLAREAEELSSELSAFLARVRAA